jgi:hypothetical protein
MFVNYTIRNVKTAAYKTEKIQGRQRFSYYPLNILHTACVMFGLPFELCNTGLKNNHL